jgi:hypothetical protein
VYATLSVAGIIAAAYWGAATDGSGSPQSAARARTAPVRGDHVFSPVRVAGLAPPGATVDARIFDATGDLGASRTVSRDGSFDFVLPYKDAAENAPLTLAITQTVNGVVSETTEVSLKQAPLFKLEGLVSQSSGPVGGTVVRVRVYPSSTESMTYLKEVEIAATEGESLPARPYGFRLGRGSYTVRAFRDTGGPMARGPDGQPTLGADAQAPGLAVTVTGADSTGNDLHLVDTGTASRYQGFDTFASHEAEEGNPPWIHEGGRRYPGSGLCSGFLMRISATAGSAAGLVDLTAPSVRLPDNSDVTLLDDGGCSEKVHDNTRGSYDQMAGDHRFSFGISDPGDELAGDYALHYRNRALDLIHVEVDRVAEVVRLSRRTILTAPTGAARVRTTTPTLTWLEAPGASAYSLDVRPVGREIAEARAGIQQWVNGPTYTIPSSQALPDATSFVVSIDPLLLDEQGGIDARAKGVYSFFLVDVAGDRSIRMSGTVVNETGVAADAIVFARGDSRGDVTMSFDGSVVVPAGSTAWAIDVLAAADCPGDVTRGRVLAVLDADRSGDVSSNANWGINSEVFLLDSCSDSTGLAWRLRPAIETVAPERGATGTGNTPEFRWIPYEQTYLAATGVALDLSGMSYILAIGRADDYADIAWILPTTVTSFDLAHPPATAVDLLTVLADDGAASSTDLSASTRWLWEIDLADCRFAESGQARTDLITCCRILFETDERRITSAGHDLPFSTR